MNRLEMMPIFNVGVGEGSQWLYTAILFTNYSSDPKEVDIDWNILRLSNIPFRLRREGRKLHKQSRHLEASDLSLA